MHAIYFVHVSKSSEQIKYGRALQIVQYTLCITPHIFYIFGSCHISVQNRKISPLEAVCVYLLMLTLFSAL